MSARALILPLSTITTVSKLERFGKDLIEIYHNQQGANSPCFVGPGKDIDDVLVQIQGMIGLQRTVAPPPPPLPVQPPTPRIQAPQAAPMLPQADSGKRSFCSNCGSPLEAGLKFCTNCGTKIELKPTTCPSCGSELSPGMKFCGSCGTSLA